MPPCHSIRLRGPWDVQPLPGATVLADGSDAAPRSPGAAPKRVVFPADWPALLGPEFSGYVRCTRDFHLPTGLESDQQVWLVIEGADCGAEVWLNAERLGGYRPLGPTGRARFDVTRRLRDRNQLVLEIEIARETDQASTHGSTRDARQPSCPAGEVRLEIEEP
jgi:hypothetical protein